MLLFSFVLNFVIIQLVFGLSLQSFLKRRLFIYFQSKVTLLPCCEALVEYIQGRTIFCNLSSMLQTVCMNIFLFYQNHNAQQNYTFCYTKNKKKNCSPDYFYQLITLPYRKDLEGFLSYNSSFDI